MSIPPLPASQTRADDPCWIALSSGTSGDPKGVLCSHGYMLDRVGKSVYVRTPQSRLLPLDLNFGTGFGQSMRMMVAGGAVVLIPDTTPANQAYMVRSHGVTHWLLSPVMAEEVALLLDDDDVHFSSLLCLQIVGGMPSPRLLDILKKRFTPNVLVVYGTVEIGPVSIATPEMLEKQPESAGRIAPWVEAEVVDERDQPLPSGQSAPDGRRHGRRVLSRSRAERRPVRDGWYYPRDRARIDAEGMLFIEGREDDVFNVGGNKIYFRVVETVLQSHPVVREAAAFVVKTHAARDDLAAAIIATRPVPIHELQQWGGPATRADLSATLVLCGPAPAHGEW